MARPNVFLFLFLPYHLHLEEEYIMWSLASTQKVPNEIFFILPILNKYLKINACSPRLQTSYTMNLINWIDLWLNFKSQRWNIWSCGLGNKPTFNLELVFKKLQWKSKSTWNKNYITLLKIYDDLPILFSQKGMCIAYAIGISPVLN